MDSGSWKGTIRMSETINNRYSVGPIVLHPPFIPTPTRNQKQIHLRSTIIIPQARVLSMKCSALSLCVLLPVLIQSVLSASTDSLVHIGSGTLISIENYSYYGVVVYANIGSTSSAKNLIMSTAAREFDDFCVGYMIDNASNRGALIFDMSKIGSSTWPPASPPSLSSFTFSGAQRTTPGGEARALYLSRPVSTSAKVGIPDVLRKAAPGRNHSRRRGNPHVQGTDHLVCRHAVQGHRVDGGGGTGSHDTCGDPGRGRLCRVPRSPDSEWWPIPRGRPVVWLFSTQLVATNHPHRTQLRLCFMVQQLAWNWTGVVRSECDVGKGWAGWQCYAKIDMMYNPTTYIGEGTLLDSTNTYYGVVQYSGISSTEKDLWSAVRRALIQCGSMCVGFHYKPVNDGQYLQAALLYDRNVTSTPWPTDAPPSLSTASVVWSSPDSSGWRGFGSPSNTASVAAGKGWNGWQCYASAWASFRSQFNMIVLLSI